MLETTILRPVPLDQPSSDREDSIRGISDMQRNCCRAHQTCSVPRSFDALPHLSAVEKVELPLLVAGVKPSLARQRAQEALDMAGLAEQAHKRASEMSEGQRHRVVIAQVLVNEPALDRGDSAEAMEMLCRLVKRSQ